MCGIVVGNSLFMMKIEGVASDVSVRLTLMDVVIIVIIQIGKSETRVKTVDCEVVNKIVKLTDSIIHCVSLLYLVLLWLLLCLLHCCWCRATAALLSDWR